MQRRQSVARFKTGSHWIYHEKNQIGIPITILPERSDEKIILDSCHESRH